MSVSINEPVIMKCYQCGNIPAHHPETTKTKKKPQKENPPDAERRETCVQHQNTDIKESCAGISAGNYLKKKLLSYLIKRRKRKKSRKSPVVSVYHFKLSQQKSSASLLPAVRQMCAAARTSSTSQHWLQVQIHFTPAIIQTL